MAGAERPAPLIIEEHGDFPRQIVLEREEEVMGRSRDCSICVRSVLVSRRHAIFKRLTDTRQWSVSDAGSKNGVYVNGQRVDLSNPRVLERNDVVSLGPLQKRHFVFLYTTTDPRQDALALLSHRSKNERAFLVLIVNRGANFAENTASAIVEQPVASATEGNSSSNELVVDRENNNSGVADGPQTSTAIHGGRHTGSSKNIRLSQWDSNNVVRRVETIMENEMTCIICSELFVDAVMLQCGHTFCAYCIQNWRKQRDCCPFCQVKISSVTRSFVVDNVIEELVCFNPELEKSRKQLVRSRLLDVTGRGEEDMRV
ncbi:RING finger protein 141-like [Ixodes scapularis]|uniref:RING finger protein 141-like n=1 Tax=Ixodes scapularis TaxID=6945 RepID=UPI001A9E4B4D|nr:RING finger protein 141-like [Ixodes scapularis]